MGKTRFAHYLMALGSAGLLLALLFLVIVSTSHARPQRVVSLENSSVRLVFQYEEGGTGPGWGLTLHHIDVLAGEGVPLLQEGLFRFLFRLDDLWTFRLRLPEGDIFSLFPSEAHYAFHIHFEDTHTLTAVWEVVTPVKWAADGSATVTVTIALGPHAPYALWWINVDDQFPNLEYPGPFNKAQWWAIPLFGIVYGAHFVQHVHGPTKRRETLPPRSLLILVAAACPEGSSAYPGPFTFQACFQHLPMLPKVWKEPLAWSTPLPPITWLLQGRL